MSFLVCFDMCYCSTSGFNKPWNRQHTYVNEFLQPNLAKLGEKCVLCTFQPHFWCSGCQSQLLCQFQWACGMWQTDWNEQHCMLFGTSIWPKEIPLNHLANVFKTLSSNLFIMFIFWRNLLNLFTFGSIVIDYCYINFFFHWNDFDKIGVFI